jgi:hypothetical protein
MLAPSPVPGAIRRDFVWGRDALAQDAALSRLKHGFESRRERQ